MSGVPPYTKAVWYEPTTKSIEHHIIPTVWIQAYKGVEVVRWPNKVNATSLITDKVIPTPSWQVYKLLEKVAQGKDKYFDML